MLLKKLNQIKMDLGSCFAVFMVIACVLLALFCLLLKWYAYRLHKKTKRAATRYSSVSEIHDLAQNNLHEGAYEQYCQHKQQLKKQLGQSLLNEEQFMETPLKRQITKISNDFYGLSSLRQRLNRDSNQSDPFRSHQIIPLKKLSFSRINTMDSKLQSKTWRHIHEYIKRLICYQRSVISLVEVEAQSLSKQEDNVFLKKRVQQTLILADEPQFEKFLDSFGLQRFTYCYNKVVCQVDISEIKNHATYSLKSLQMKQFKQDINKDQYHKLLNELKSG